MPYYKIPTKRIIVSMKYYIEYFFALMLETSSLELMMLGCSTKNTQGAKRLANLAKGPVTSVTNTCTSNKTECQNTALLKVNYKSCPLRLNRDVS